MRQYKSYMDHVKVSGDLHRRLAELEGPGKRPVPWVKYASLAAALALGLVMAGAGLLCQDELIWRLGSTSTIFPYARDYAFYIILGTPVMILSFTLNNLLRWQGKASLAVFGLATGGILNMILDPIFIYAFDPCAIILCCVALFLKVAF